MNSEQMDEGVLTVEQQTQARAVVGKLRDFSSLEAIRPTVLTVTQHEAALVAALDDVKDAMIKALAESRRRLQQTIEEQNISIKALADALERVKGYFPDFEDGPAGVCKAEIDTALHLVGRLP